MIFSSPFSMPMRFARSAWICSTSLLKALPSNVLQPSRSLKENCPVALMFNREPGLPGTTSSISSCFAADLVSFSLKIFQFLAQNMFSSTENPQIEYEKKQETLRIFFRYLFVCLLFILYAKLETLASASLSFKYQMRLGIQTLSRTLRIRMIDWASKLKNNLKYD